MLKSVFDMFLSINVKFPGQVVVELKDVPANQSYVGLNELLTCFCCS